jgi:hypothetical protein
VVLEAVADEDLYCWHASFGHPGSVNDLTIVGRSPLVQAFAAGEFPPPGFCYDLLGQRKTLPYYLADGIYPLWQLFAKTISAPQDFKTRLYAKSQESVRKDVDRLFGVLRSRFQVLERAARAWRVPTLNRIIRTCLILHNMCVKELRREPHYAV